MAGSGLLIATAAIHLDLYVTGYRTIPTIGWLFLLQVIAAFGLGLAVAIPHQLVTAGRLAAGAGAGFALATLGGYLRSVWIGLFGFREVRMGAGIAAGLVEVATFVVLAALGLTPAPTHHTAGHAGCRDVRVGKEQRCLGWFGLGPVADELAVGPLDLLDDVELSAVELRAFAFAPAGASATAAPNAGRLARKHETPGPPLTYGSHRGSAEGLSVFPPPVLSGPE